MKDEEILRRAIEKSGLYKDWWLKHSLDGFVKEALLDNSYYSIIYNHDFAKAFWGEKEIETNLLEVYDAGGNLPDTRMIFLPAWQYRLQQMVIEKSPLKYLEKFL